MIESPDNRPSDEDFGLESQIRGKDEEPTETHGGYESEQAGGSGAGPEGADREDTHKPPERERAAQEEAEERAAQEQADE